MKAPETRQIPRWLTALFMFVCNFLLVALTYINDIVGTLYYFITILLAIGLWIYIDKQPPEEIGFQFSQWWWLQLILGIVLAMVVLGLFIWLEIILGWVILTPIFNPQQLGVIAGFLAMYALWQGLVAGSEELVMRGYIQQNLATKLRNLFAILSASVMFAVLHVPNIIFNTLPPLNATIMLMNLFLGGVMLGLAFFRTRTLWLPIGLHFGWNFTLYHIAGFGGNGLYQVQNNGLQMVTGGSIGPEAGLIGTIAFLFLIIILWILTKRLD